MADDLEGAGRLRGGRDPLLDDVLVLSLVDRVWQAGEAWARAGLLAEEAAVEVGRWALPAAEPVRPIGPGEPVGGEPRNRARKAVSLTCGR